MKTVRIRVSEARIPEGVDLTHVSTSYRVSKSTDMTDESQIVFESLEDSINLLEILIDLDISNLETVYCSTRYHYIDNNGVNYQSKWSLAAPVQGHRHGITYPDTIVKTPKVNQMLDDDGIFTIYTNPMEIFTGIGDHVSTTWEIEDSDGFPVYFRPDDKDNKEKLYPEFKPVVNKAYIVKAKHTVTGNNDSYTGKSVYLNYTKGVGLYDFEVISKFYVDTNVWHRLKIYVPNFKNYDLEIRRPNGEVVKKLYDCGILVYYINTFGFKYNNVYEWWVRVRFQDDSVTEFKKEWEGLALDKDESPDWDEDPNISFLGKITDGPSFDIKGDGNQLTSILSYEITSKEFFYVRDGKIVLLKWDNNSIVYVKDLLDPRTLNGTDPDLDIDEMVIPYITFTKHDDFQVFIHYRVQNNNSQWGKTIFLLANYNPITKELELITTNSIRDDVNHMGIANNIVRKSKSNYWGVMESDPTIKPIKEGLWLLKIEVTNDAINLTKYIAIKKGRFSFARLIVNKNKDLFIVGGTTGSNTNIDTSELIYKRSNNTIKRIDTNKLQVDKNNIYDQLPDSFDATRVQATIPTEYSPFTQYDFMPISLASGDILLFNNCNSGEMMFNQNLLIYSTMSGLFRQEEYDLKLKVPFRNIVRFNNWDILRISSNVESKQATYVYLSSQNNPNDFKDSTKELKYPKILTFKDKITNLEVPYHFEYGDNGNVEDKEIINPPMEKSVRWVDKKQYREITFSNIMYTRSKLKGLVEEGLPTEWTKGINLLNNVHLRVGLGQIIGENSYQVGHGANPYPYEPYIKLKSPDVISIQGTNSVKVIFDHNGAELDYEFVNNESKNYVTVTVPDPDNDKFSITLRGKNVAGKFSIKVHSLGVDGEVYKSTIITGNTTV